MRRTVVLCLVMGWLAAPAQLAAEGQAPEEPPAPKPSAAVQEILDEALRLAQANRPQDELKAGDRALAVAQEAKDSVGEAQAYRARALALQTLRRTKEALVAWREAAMAWERLGDGPGRVEALAIAAGLLLGVGEQVEAEALCAQALALGRAESKRPLAAAATLNTVGIFYNRRGLPSLAREFFETSLVIRNRLIPNSLLVAGSLNNLGGVAIYQGDLVAAKQYLRRALAIYENLAPNTRNVAGILDNLGTIARQQGDLAVAAAYFRQALALQEKLAPDSRDVAASLSSLGSVAKQQGDLAAAREHIRQALALQEKLAPDSRDVASSLNNLGVVALEQGDKMAAEKYFRQALVIKETLAPNSLEVATSLANLGLVMSPSDAGAAREYCLQALALQEKLAPNSLGVAASLNSLGIVAWQQGDLVAAEDYHRRALEIREKLAPSSMDVAMSLSYLGRIAQKQRDLRGAERHYQRAWELVRHQAAVVTGDEARKAFGTSTALHAVDLMRFQLALGKPEAAFFTLEESRARALQQLLLERQVVPKAADPALWSAYRMAVAARDRAEQAVSQAGVEEARAGQALAGQRAPGAVPERLAATRGRLAAAQKKLAEDQSVYTQTRLKADQLWEVIKRDAPRAFVAPLTLDQALKTLPAGTLFAAFAVDADQIHLFLLRSGPGRGSPLSAFSLALPEEELRALVDALQAAVTTTRSTAPAVQADRTLFAKLFPAEAQNALRAAKRLLISADGPLGQMSFAALVTNAQGLPRYLGAQVPITYTPSLGVFAQARTDAPRLANGRKPVALVVGDSIFDRTLGRTTLAAGRPRAPRGERGHLFGEDGPPPPLAGSRAEAIKICALYGCVPLLGEDATEAAVRARIGGADLIHLATHGYLHPRRAMSSGVLLSVPEKEPGIGETDNDGVLQAWEVYSQLSLQADLVVLSACESGRGDVIQGEGLIGMTRALQYAGARSILASQWKADDQATLILMTAFHRGLGQGLAKDEALRQAMADVRRRAEWVHPYYWAGFLLTGDPDNPGLGAPAVKRNGKRISGRR